MATYDVDARKLGAMILNHETKRRIGIGSALTAATKAGVRIIKENAPEALGDLKNSVHQDGNTVVVDAPHAVFVELGGRPHMPPIGPLIKWAAAVGANDPEAAAWAVAEKIQREGTRPTYFVRRSIPKIMEATGAAVRYVLKKD